MYVYIYIYIYIMCICTHKVIQGLSVPSGLLPAVDERPATVAEGQRLPFVIILCYLFVLLVCFLLLVVVLLCYCVVSVLRYVIVCCCTFFVAEGQRLPPFGKRCYLNY